MKFLKNCFSAILLIFFVVSAVLAFDNTAANRNKVADFDGDGKSDVSVFRPSDGFWHIMKSTGGFSSIQWGQKGDRLVPGDYDGDGRTDLAVSRVDSCVCVFETANTWYIRRSSDNSFFARKFERNASSFAEPAPADYDGDGQTDFAFYDGTDTVPGRSRFRIYSNSGPVRIHEMGNSAFQNLQADYDGDGRADIATFVGFNYSTNTQDNSWYITQSSDGRGIAVRFGLSSDSFVPADYDGDGKTDLAVFRRSNGTWYIQNSSDESFYAMQFGLSTDKLVPADYDGDGRTDIAVFRPSNGTWYLLQSTEGFAAHVFGSKDDIPIPSVY